MNATASKREERPIRRPARLLVAIGALAMLGSLGPAGAQDLVRAEFQQGSEVFLHGTAGVYDDGLSVDCGDTNGIRFSYADETDTACDPPELTKGLISILSKGGAWRLSGMNSNPDGRTLHLNFLKEFASDGACVELAKVSKDEGDCGCDTPEPCSVHVWVGPDRLFKKRATRQSLGGRFDIFENGGGPEWRINWIDPLYLCEDPDPNHKDDSSWRVMQSVSCVGDTPPVDVSLAEVVRTSDNISIGEFYLPIQIRVQRVSPPPPDDPGDPPPDDSCPLLPKDADCDSDSECCSDNCKGKRDNKTCK